MTASQRSFARWLGALPGDAATFTRAGALGALAATIVWHALAITALSWWLLGELPLAQAELLVALGWEYSSGADLLRKNLYIFGVAMFLEGAIAYLAWRLVRAREPRATPWHWFLICWWYACLLGTVVIAVALLLAWWTFGDARPALAIVPAFMLVAPAALAPRVLPTRQRWRPVCPECGHTVAYAVKPRCSECGQPYPCPDRFYRRWAIRRLPWERRERTLLFAYIQTLFFVLFRPAMAAWRLADPTCMSRAIRWMVGHALLPGALLLALFWGASFWLPQGPFAGVSLADASPALDACWTAEWLLAWTLAGVCFPAAIGVTLSAATPAVQPNARLGMIKWSLYAAVVPFGLGAIGAAVVLGWEFAGLPASASVPATVQLFSMAMAGAGFDRFNLTLVVLGALVALYAVWWAIGVAAQPYLRRRGFVVFLVALGAFLLVWRLTALLFNLHGFEGLL